MQDTMSSSPLFQTFPAAGSNGEARAVVSALRELYGDMPQKELFANALADIEFAKQLSESTGIPLSSELGAINMLDQIQQWRAKAAEAKLLEKRVAELEAVPLAQEVEDLIAQGRRAGKITPALAKFWRDKPPDAIREFLASAPQVLPTHAVPPPTTLLQGALADNRGRRYEDIAPAQRAAMKANDPDGYGALRTDWIERGRPRGAQ